MFPEELEKGSFRAKNGEYGWTRAQVPQVVETISAQSLAILGGELWWVLDDSVSWNGLIPQREGPDVVFKWETKRHPKEPWSGFVSRCASDTIAAVKSWPIPGDLPSSLTGRILYNLTWVGEAEYGQLRGRVV